MRRFLLVFAVVFAARTAAAQSMKIGYVDTQRAMVEVEEGKTAKAQLQTELQRKRGDLEKRRADLEKMKTDFDKQAPVLSDEAKRKKQDELQKAYIDWQNSGQKMQEELSQSEQEVMGNISKRLYQVVAEISDKEGFTFVLDKAALLYAPAASDVTNEVVRRYNERFGGGSQAAGKAPPKPKK